MLQVELAKGTYRNPTNGLSIKTRSREVQIIAPGAMDLMISVIPTTFGARGSGANYVSFKLWSYEWHGDNKVQLIWNCLFWIYVTGRPVWIRWVDHPQYYPSCPSQVSRFCNMFCIYVEFIRFQGQPFCHLTYFTLACSSISRSFTWMPHLVCMDS